MKYILIAIFIALVGCGGDTTTTYTASTDDNGTVLPLYIDDTNVSDIIHMIDVSTIAVTDQGILVFCTDGAVCSVTTDDGNESSDTITSTVTENNSSS